MAHILTTSLQKGWSALTNNQAVMQLAIYSFIPKYIPRVGDIIQCYGWFSRVKWFGVVTAITPDGHLIIAKEGSMRLLVMSQEYNRQIVKIHISITIIIC